MGGRGGAVKSEGGGAMSFWRDRGTPPVLKVLRVLGLSNPDFLIEIEGIAALAE